MNWKARINESWSSGVGGAALCAGLGLGLWLFPNLGKGLAHWSYDLGFLFRPPASVERVVLVYIDGPAERHFQQSALTWDRRLHAMLLDRLRADGAKVVVFDIYFEPRASDANLELARAMREHGNVVLAAYEETSSTPGITVKTTLEPADFLDTAAAWGLAMVPGDKSTIIRQYHPGNDWAPSLPVAAARRAGLGPALVTPPKAARHWLNYYGPSGTVITNLSYAAVTNQPPGYFRDKFVFVGGRRGPDYMEAPGDGKVPGPDEFPTPYSRWGGVWFPGMEIVATAFANLANHEWLERLATGWELFLTLSGGLALGFLLGIVRPLPAVGLAALGFALVAGTSIVLMWQTRIWGPWLWITGAQLPLAVGWSVLAQTRRLLRQKADLEKVIESHLTAGTRAQEAIETVSGPAATVAARKPAPEAAPVAIPDHTLLRRIGRGAYGEVWLAQNAVGMFRAVKIVRQNEFSREGPYEREFNGIRKFMPVSLQHPRLLHLLHVGRNDAAGYFYAIMEVADDETTGQTIAPERYRPRTLAGLLKKQGALAPAECAAMVLALTDALGFLHQRRLIHRDIKPANIIFADGAAKLADIGLVTEAAGMGRGVTLIGTAGYMAPEGPGTAVADLYSLGKVMYEAIFGRDPDLFPELPTGLDQRADYALVKEFNRIIGKACQTNPARRYQSAAEIHAEIQRLLAR